ncbi:hypothetical protein BKA64DRAFT_636856 [Cadophora sp. MPI-SDFR-AT-0126]|nr:hypothetical protein BKA64DRAFT_636856 [Leotiomycetes sp. MPI-SDFR-AT-0126]
MGLAEILRQFCCFASAPESEKEDEPSRPARLIANSDLPPSTRRLRTEAAFRKHLAEISNVTHLNPDHEEGTETLGRHFIAYFAKPSLSRKGRRRKGAARTWWTEYQELPPLDPRLRWA